MCSSPILALWISESCIITDRPVVIVQNDVGCFFSETLTIVPLTSQLKRPDLESHYILQEAGFLKKRSMALAEAINTIDKRQNPL